VGGSPRAARNPPPSRRRHSQSSSPRAFASSSIRSCGHIEAPAMLPATHGPSLQPLRARNARRRWCRGGFGDRRSSCVPPVARYIGVGARWLLVVEEGGAGVDRGESPLGVELVWNMMLGALGFQHTAGSAHPPAPAEQPTLRTTATLQGVPPSCCGPRAAVWSGACSSRPSTGAGKRHDAQAGCEPGVESCGGLPVHPARLHTHRTSPAQALLIDTCCNV
jgi:hypothetical protein